MRTAIAIILALVPSLAFGQGAIRQNGPSTKYDMLGFIQDHQAEAVSKLFTDNARGANPIHIFNSGGDGVCTEDAPTTGPYHQICIGHNTGGNAVIDINSFNGASVGSPIVSFNGTSYPLIGGGGGNVTGPNSTSMGHVALFNNTVGSLLSDGGTVRQRAESLPTANTVYARSFGGSDANDCLAATVTGGHGPCLTIQHAVDVASSKYDAGSQNLTIDICGSGFNKGASISMPIVGAGSGALQGTSGSTLWFKGCGSASAVVADTTSGATGTFICTGPGIVTISGMTISTTQSGASDLYEQSGCVVENYIDMVYGAAPGPQIQLESNSLWETGQNWTVTGGGAAFASVTGGSFLEIDPSGLTLTLAGTPAYTLEFFNVIEGGIVYFPLNLTVVGSATGNRYNIDSNGVIDTSGSTLSNRIPGNAAGTVAHGGRYMPPLLITNVSSCTNLGVGGTCATTNQSDSKHGEILLSTGSSATGAVGSFTIAFPESLGLATVDGICLPALDTANSGATWSAGAYAYVSGYGTNFCTISWTNNGNNLSTGVSYKIAYRAGS